MNEAGKGVSILPSSSSLRGAARGAAAASPPPSSPAAAAGAVPPAASTSRSASPAPIGPRPGAPGASGASSPPRTARLHGATGGSWTGSVGQGLKNAALRVGHAPARVAHGVMQAPGALTRVARGIPSALANAPSTLGTAARHLWSLTDLRTMLQPRGDDPAFLSVLRGHDPEAASPARLADCRRQVNDLRAVVDGSRLEPRFKATVLQDLQAIDRALEPLQHGTPAAGRAFKALANLVNLWPAIVPSPLLAHQAKTFAYTVAAATKAVVGVAGTTLRSTADGLPFPLMGGELGRQADEVHFYPALLNAIFLSLEMTKKFGSEAARRQVEAFDQNKLGHAGIAAACGMALIAPFVWDSIQNLAGQASHAVVRAGAAVHERLGHGEQAEAMRRRITPGEVGDALQAQLRTLWAELEAGRQAFTQARADFTAPASGHELTRTLNAQVTHLLGTIGRCTERLEKALHLAPPDGNGGADGADGAALAAGDANFASKLALTVFAAGVTGATVFLIQPDPIGTVDLSADAVVVTAVMAQAAWNRQATRQDAMERFKGMAATSMVMALALSADKIAKAFTPNGMIEASAEAPYYAALVMTVMAMTLPGPVARGAELAMNWGGGQIARLFQAPDAGPPGTVLPQSPRALVERTAELAAQLQSMSPQAQARFEAEVAQNLMDLIGEATAAPHRAAQEGVSRVVIENITDRPGNEGASGAAATAEAPAQGADAAAGNESAGSRTTAPV